MPTANEELNIGAALREVRNLRGLTQQQLADEAGLSDQTISQVETGQRGLTRKNVARLAGVLNVPPSFLYVLSDAQPDDLVEHFKSLVRAALLDEERRGARASAKKPSARARAEAS